VPRVCLNTELRQPIQNIRPRSYVVALWPVIVSVVSDITYSVEVHTV
jgi:hypothetical protein